jgi:hypothetical protein
MRTTRHGVEAFFADGSLYAIGGCTTALHDSQVVEKRPLDVETSSDARVARAPVSSRNGARPD